MKWNLQITVNTSRPCMQGLGAASASILAVEVVPYRLSGHSFEALWTGMSLQAHNSKGTVVDLKGRFSRTDVSVICNSSITLVHMTSMFAVVISSFRYLIKRCNWYILVTFLDCGLHDMCAPLFDPCFRLRHWGIVCYGRERREEGRVTLIPRMVGQKGY
jgi:hypothetical protein